jgi:hypothetical protein
MTANGVIRVPQVDFSILRSPQVEEIGRYGGLGLIL